MLLGFSRNESKQRSYTPCFGVRGDMIREPPLYANELLAEIAFYGLRLSHI